MQFLQYVLAGWRRAHSSGNSTPPAVCSVSGIIYPWWLLARSGLRPRIPRYINKCVRTRPHPNTTHPTLHSEMIRQRSPSACWPVSPPPTPSSSPASKKITRGNTDFYSHGWDRLDPADDRPWVAAASPLAWPPNSEAVPGAAAVGTTRIPGGCTVCTLR